MNCKLAKHQTITDHFHNLFPLQGTAERSRPYHLQGHHCSICGSFQKKKRIKGEEGSLSVYMWKVEEKTTSLYFYLKKNKLDCRTVFLEKHLK